jgi:multiple sugar transport system substrate-binding protein
LGGLSCNKKVLESEKFLNASPLNGAFKESIELADDFWAVTEYPVLLKISQKYFNKYVTKGDITAKEALDKIADEWEEVFEHAGYYKE